MMNRYSKETTSHASNTVDPSMVKYLLTISLIRSVISSYCRSTNAILWPFGVNMRE